MWNVKESKQTSMFLKIRSLSSPRPVILSHPSVGSPSGTGTSGPERQSFRVRVGQSQQHEAACQHGRDAEGSPATAVGPVSDRSELRVRCLHLMPVPWCRLTFLLPCQTFAAPWQLRWFWLMHRDNTLSPIRGGCPFLVLSTVVCCWA